MTNLLIDYLSGADHGDYLLSLGPEWYYMLDDVAGNAFDISAHGYSSLTYEVAPHVTRSAAPIGTNLRNRSVQMDTDHGRARAVGSVTGGVFGTDWTIVTLLRLRSAPPADSTIITFTFNELFGYNAFALGLGGSNHRVPFSQCNAQGGGGVIAAGVNEIANGGAVLLAQIKRGNALEMWVGSGAAVVKEGEVLAGAGPTLDPGGGSFYIGGGVSLATCGPVDLSNACSFKRALTTPELTNAVNYYGL